MLHTQELVPAFSLELKAPVGSERVCCRHLESSLFQQGQLEGTSQSVATWKQCQKVPSLPLLNSLKYQINSQMSSLNAKDLEFIQPAWVVSAWQAYHA